MDKFNIKGLDLFAETFKDFSENYIIIGGTACSLVMEEAGLDFRSTKDIDVALKRFESPFFGLFLCHSRT